MISIDYLIMSYESLTNNQKSNKNIYIFAYSLLFNEVAESKFCFWE
jgi:hypothetical protein